VLVLAKDIDADFADKIKLMCNSDDKELNHINADDALRELLQQIGMTKTVDAFDEIDKWYS
jgi:hypothetical protein